MSTKATQTEYVQKLLDRASGLSEVGGDKRLKAIVRDLLEQVCVTIEKHDITEDEFWGAITFIGKSHEEFGLIVPGVGLEHFMDIVLDERDKAAGIAGGTPRTIEGPLYVEGAPLSDAKAVMSTDEDEGERLIVHGIVRDEDGNPVPGAIVDVWHADTRGFYSHFDPTEAQGEFNNRRKIKVGADGRYEAHAIMPVGYSVPPGGYTDQLMKSLGRHGSRPAHVHFFVDADGYRHLTTQINIADDPLVNDDFAFGTREGLIPDIVRKDGQAEISFDIILVKKDKGADYQLSRRERLTV